MTIRRHMTLTLTFATMGALLQACAPRASGPGVRLYEADFKGGAKLCEAPRQKPVAGKVTEATMKVASDGGWCGLLVSTDNNPFAAGLLTVRPTHGKVLVHTVGNDTRIDYTPDFRFAGSDAFGVELLPGPATVRVAVTAVPH